MLGEASDLLSFLFVADDAFEYEVDALPGDEAPAVLDAAIAALAPLIHWEHASIEAALRAALIDGLGLKPRLAFGALRTALSGKRISPPLFESMELLGHDATLARLARLRARL